MKTLRRPMFRKGGEVGGGIMTGVMRDNYEVGGSARERLARVAAEFPSQAIDPVSQFLIQGGMNLAGGPASGAGVVADAFRAFKDPTTQLFKGLAQRGQMQKKLALEGEILDIEDERQERANLVKQNIADQANKVKMDIANLTKAYQESEGNKDRQNKIAVEIQKGQNKLDELQFKLDNPDADPAKQGVIPSPETRVLDLTKLFSESDNLEVASNPNLTASNIVKFQVNASPEIQSKFKGIVRYGYDNKGGIARVEPTGPAGSIFYDPKTADFLVLDNQGQTYVLNPLTFEIQE